MQNAFKPVGGGGGASGPAGGRFNCFAEPAGGVGPDFSVVAYPSQDEVKAIGQQCFNVAQRPSARDSYASITRAHFYAGRANLELAQRYREQRNPEWTAAVTQAAQELDTVVSNTRGDLGAPAASDKPANPRTPAEEARRRFAIRARLDLSRTYMMMNQGPQARERIQEVTNVEANNAEAKYLRAMVNAGRPGDADALSVVVTDLSIFAGELKNENPAVVADGRRALLERSTELGTLISRMQNGDLRRAIDAFAMAKDAAVQAEREKTLTKPVVAATFSNLGRAQLQTAGADFACTVNPADPEAVRLVSAAFTSFGEAVRYDATQASGHDGRGCALQAQGNAVQAVDEFREAVRLDGRNVDYRLHLARSLEVSRKPQDAEQAYTDALALAEGDKAQTAIIYGQIAEIHLRNYEERKEPAELQIASQALDASIKADDGYARARLRRGQLYFQKRRTARLAIDDLVRAASSSKFTSNRRDEAEAYYALSLIRAQPEASNPAEAIDYAKRAADIGGQPVYKEQVCRTYIEFLNSARLRDGAVYCQAGDNPPIRGLLQEGMYHLRTTFYTRGYEQDKGWERALDAFEYGLRRYAQGTPYEQEQTQGLKSQLSLGKSFSLGCIGLTARATEALRDVGDKDQAAIEFTKFGIGKCAPRYRY